MSGFFFSGLCNICMMGCTRRAALSVLEYMSLRPLYRTVFKSSRVLSYFFPPPTQYSQSLALIYLCDIHHPSSRFCPPAPPWGYLFILHSILESESSALEASELVAYFLSMTPTQGALWVRDVAVISIWSVFLHFSPFPRSSHPNHFAISVLLLWRRWAWRMKWRKACTARRLSCSLVARSLSDKLHWQVTLTMVHLGLKMYRTWKWTVSFSHSDGGGES